jgi:hypothetical protein
LMSRNGVTSVGSVKEWLRQKTVDTRDDISAVCPCTDHRRRLMNRTRA